MRPNDSELVFDDFRATAGSALSFITRGSSRSAGRIDSVGRARVCDGNIRRQQIRASAASRRGCMTES
jgi:hypothetical protein